MQRSIFSYDDTCFAGVSLLFYKYSVPFSYLNEVVCLIMPHFYVSDMKLFLTDINFQQNIFSLRFIFHFIFFMLSDCFIRA